MHTKKIIGFLFCMVLLFSFCVNSDRQDIRKQKERAAIDSLEIINDQIKETPNTAQLYHQRANLLFKKKEYQPAMDDIHRALSLDSTQADFYLTQSNIYFSMGKIKLSKEALDKCILIQPEHLDALLKFAEFYIYLEQYQKSIDYIQKVLEMDVYNANAYFLKGLNYKYIRDTIKAISNFQKAIEQSPNFYEAYIQLGLLYSSRHNTLAIDYFNNALNVKPKSIEAIYGKAMFFQEHGKSQEAISTYSQLIELQPKYYLAYFNIGYTYLLYFKEYKKAILYFSDAIAIKSNYFEAYYNRGLCYEQLGEKGKAEADYRKAISIKPDYLLAADGISRVVDGSK